jgi:hypothetical protein
MSFFFAKYLTSISTSLVDYIIFSGGIVEVQNPFSDSEMTGEHGKDVRAMKEEFDRLSGKEKLDVLELQDIILQTVSRYKDIGYSGHRPAKSSRTANEIISGMSSRSLDYSQQCINYFVARIAEKTKR